MRLNSYEFITVYCDGGRGGFGGTHARSDTYPGNNGIDADDPDSWGGRGGAGGGWKNDKFKMNEWRRYNGNRLLDDIIKTGVGETGGVGWQDGYYDKEQEIVDFGAMGGPGAGGQGFDIKTLKGFDKPRYDNIDRYLNTDITNYIALGRDQYNPDNVKGNLYDLDADINRNGYLIITYLGTN
ncbi:hypothetical protein FACS1894161_5300 [Spirochaetia bacterium]|nr:hypothetical protein FACS1894161_5300 [Spirochaetia bacterium]